MDAAREHPSHRRASASLRISVTLVLLAVRGDGRARATARAARTRRDEGRGGREGEPGQLPIPARPDDVAAAAAPRADLLNSVDLPAHELHVDPVPRFADGRRSGQRPGQPHLGTAGLVEVDAFGALGRLHDRLRIAVADPLRSIDGDEARVARDEPEPEA